jgi:hypothetical protein
MLDPDPYLINPDPQPCPDPLVRRHLSGANNVNRATDMKMVPVVGAERKKQTATTCDGSRRGTVKLYPHKNGTKALSWFV